MQLWIIGSSEGWGYQESYSVIVDDTESTKGPMLPWNMYMTCVTSLNSTHVIFIGGRKQGSSTLIVNHDDNWKMTVGPKLKSDWMWHMCSTLQHPNGKNYIVLAGPGS